MTTQNGWRPHREVQPHCQLFVTWRAVWPAGKRLHEKEIVRAWWEALTSLGVPAQDYPFEAAWAGYKCVRSVAGVLCPQRMHTRNASVPGR